MQWGLFTSSYQYMDLEKAFADARAFGYNYIELWGGFPHAYVYDMDDERIESIRRLSEAYQMPVKVYTPEHNSYPYNYMLGDEKQCMRCLDYLGQALVVAGKLNCEYMLMSVGHCGDKTKEEARQRLLKVLQALLPIAEKAHVRIILETLSTYESNVCTSIHELSEIVSLIHSPYLCGMCDVVACYTQNETIEDYFDGLKDKMAHIHLVDSDLISETHLVPGEGQLDIKHILDYIQDRDYKGMITIELVTHYIDNPSFAFAKAIKEVTCIK